MQKAHNHGWMPEFSAAGFFGLENSGRKTVSLNPGWRYARGQVTGTESPQFDDENWQIVNLPHGLELLPLDASGGVNYQGEAWYRKHFVLENEYENRSLILYFEAVMGKCVVWLNGVKAAEHLGGYLPIVIDISENVSFCEENVLVVWTDNSDDGTYPPGKPQIELDFSYFGGIYRDVWLVSCSKTHISDATAAKIVAGGGVFVRCEDVGEEHARVVVESDIRNDTEDHAVLKVEVVLLSASGVEVAGETVPVAVDGRNNCSVTQSLEVKKPHLWHVNSPYLHTLAVRIINKNGVTVDGVRLRVGIRSIEFRGVEGFFMNGTPIDGKLIGGNRHQDYAYVGNALPNTTHWRDVRKLREAGMRIVRSAHYPQDPAFMDACDELGMLVIVATPGWQYWNEAPSFAERVFDDIRTMVRRDRNHASVVMWEPILNETSYGSWFAQKAHLTVHEEYPFDGCYTACDHRNQGHEFFDVLYAFPPMRDNPSCRMRKFDNWEERAGEPYRAFKKSILTREWGDFVDDWSSHNSPSRVRKSWGEIPQLVQMNHYASPGYAGPCLATLHRTPRQHVGGALWHPFDHQRGYHPDPFWGGILDAFRQPKYSFYLFKSQMRPDVSIDHVPTGPFVYIAHEMTPFSPGDVCVVSNCDKVRLRVLGEEVGTKSTVQPGYVGMPHEPVVFENAFRFLDVKELSRAGNGALAIMEAEGLIDGVVVARAVKRPALRRVSIRLEADFAGAPLVADGSDFVPVVASIVDEHGQVKRLTGDFIRFEVTGEGSLIDDGRIEANPCAIMWGEAVALVRATTTPGRIAIRAQMLRAGAAMPAAADLIIESVAPSYPLLFRQEDDSGKQTCILHEVHGAEPGPVAVTNVSAVRERLADVGRQQERFAAEK